MPLGKNVSENTGKHRNTHKRHQCVHTHTHRETQRPQDKTVSTLLLLISFPNSSAMERKVREPAGRWQKSCWLITWFQANHLLGIWGVVYQFAKQVWAFTPSTDHEAHLNEGFKELCYSGNRIPERKCSISFLESHVTSRYSSRIFTIESSKPTTVGISVHEHRCSGKAWSSLLLLSMAAEGIRSMQTPVSFIIAHSPTLIQKDHSIPNPGAQSGPERTSGLRGNCEKARTLHENPGTDWILHRGLERDVSIFWLFDCFFVFSYQGLNSRSLLC